MDLTCLSNGEASPLLGPGFKFHPTEEELISYYLTQKVANRNSVFQAIGDVDFNKCEPGDLPSLAKVRDQGNFYFFSLKDRKYSRGMRKNRATRAGCWKSSGLDREVKTGVKNVESGRLLGMKKTLVFYTGRGPKGVKTSWIMHELRLPDQSKSDQHQWVVCKVFKKKGSNKMAAELPALPSPGSPGSSSVKPNTVPELPDHVQPNPALPSPGSPGSSSVKPNTVPELPDHVQPNPALPSPGSPGSSSVKPNTVPELPDHVQPNPALPSPGSPGSSSVKPNTVPEPPDHVQPNPAMTLEQSKSTFKGTPDEYLSATFQNLLLPSDMGFPVPMLDINGGLDLSATFENLLFPWDMGFPVPMLDINGGLSSEIYFF